MPFGEPFDELYHEVIRPTVEAMEMRCLRADEVFSVGPIMQDILQGIARAGVIIADVTGRNPNVFYELGIAHTVKDRVIIVSQSMDDVPFDLKHIRMLIYETSLRGIRRFSSRLKATLEAVLKQPSSSLSEGSSGSRQSQLNLFPESNQVSVGEEVVQLTEDEFALVSYLFSAGGPVRASSVEMTVLGKEWYDTDKMASLLSKVHKKLVRLPSHPVIVEEGDYLILV